MVVGVFAGLCLYVKTSVCLDSPWCLLQTHTQHIKDKKNKQRREWFQNINITYLQIVFLGSKKFNFLTTQTNIYAIGAEIAAVPFARLASPIDPQGLPLQKILGDGFQVYSFLCQSWIIILPSSDNPSICMVHIPHIG